MYQAEVISISKEESFEKLNSYFETNKKAVPYAKKIVSGVTEKWDEVNKLIEENSANWRISRMSLIDRNILRIATYEMCCTKEVPPSVVIDEAIEVARRFSSDDSCSFINGILDAIRKNN